MLLTRTAAPAADLITEAELKAHLRIDHAYDDATITALRSVVSEFLDGRNGYLQRALVTQTWAWRLPLFPVSRELHIPLPPLQSVVITYYDTDDVLQTYSADNYYVITQDVTGYVKLKAGCSWPSIKERDDAVIVTFVAGYGAASAVPVAIKHAALLAAGRLYANRGDGEVLSSAAAIAETSLSSAEKSLLNPYRIAEFNHAHERYWLAPRTRAVYPPR